MNELCFIAISTFGKVCRVLFITGSFTVELSTENLLTLVTSVLVLCQ